MAAGDRSKQLYGKIELTLGTVDEKPLAAVHNKLTQSLILDTMGEFATKLAEDYLCLEKSATISVSAGTVAEPSGFFRGNLIVMPTGYSLQLRELDPVQFDHLDRSTLTLCAQTPTFYKRWGGTLTFYPTVTASYTMLYWGVPTTTPTASVDPETPVMFDKTIEYGVIAELAPLIGRGDLATFYLQRFDNERREALSAWRRSKSVQYRIIGRDVV